MFSPLSSLIMLLVQLPSTVNSVFVTLISIKLIFVDGVFYPDVYHPYPALLDIALVSAMGYTAYHIIVAVRGLFRLSWELLVHHLLTLIAMHRTRSEKEYGFLACCFLSILHFSDYFL